MKSVAIQLLAAALAGWMSRRQQEVIEYLREENRVLREQTGRRRLRITMVMAMAPDPSLRFGSPQATRRGDLVMHDQPRLERLSCV